MSPHITIDKDRIGEFCHKWQITECSLFGSVLGDKFGPNSDIDVLVAFAPEAIWSLLDMVEMRDELQEIFGRNVDLLTRRAVERSTNWIRRRAILENTECIYAQG
jgi:predicted nucleotidyltransferase